MSNSRGKISFLMVLKNLLTDQWLGLHSLTAEGLHSEKENGPPPKNNGARWLDSWLHAQSLRCILLFATLCTVAHQGPLFIGFSRQDY